MNNVFYRLNVIDIDVELKHVKEQEIESNAKLQNDNE
jgi:hypothetical protein